MKKILFAFVVLAFSIGCSKDSDNDGGDIAQISMTLDGNAWESSDDGPHSPTGAVVAFTQANSSIVIQGYAEDGSYLSITAASTAGPVTSGVTYSSSDFTHNAQMQYQPNFGGGVSYFSALTMDGSITFSNATEGDVSATFEFVGRNTSNDEVVVTNGTVEVKK